MYKRCHTIDNKGILFPVVFLVGPEQITIRTFVPISAPAMPDEQQFSLDEALAYIAQHEKPYELMRRTVQRYIVPGELFGSAFAGQLYQQADTLGMTRDAAALGVSAAADASVFMLCVDHHGQLRLPFNRTAYTMQERLGKYTMYRDMQLNSVLTLAIDFADQPWVDGQLFLRYNKQAGGLVLLEDSVKESKFQHWGFHDRPVYDALPTVVVAPLSLHVRPGEMAHFSVRTIDPDSGKTRPSSSTIYLEAVSGYLPHTRVTLKEGEGTFKAMALGLEPGDALRVKAGFRFMPGLGDASVSVRATE